MKKDNLSKKLTYKESIDRYDVEFIYKDKTALHAASYRKRLR